MAGNERYYYVYILGSLSGTLYIGITGNLRRRIFQHKFRPSEGFAKEYEVNRLLYWESFTSVYPAIAREKQLKGWRREKKVALIRLRNEGWMDLARDWYDSSKVW